MQWADINSIILPLFISTATPIEKQRDTIMSTSHAQVLAYCKDMPMAKSRDYSYPCRQQIEADCLELGTTKACDLLAKLKDAEKDAREKQIAAREKKKDTTFWCVVEQPRISPPLERTPGSDNYGNGYKAPAMTGGITNYPFFRELPRSAQEKVFKVEEQIKKISKLSYSNSCREDKDCKVLPVGHKVCGGHLGAIYFSGSLPILDELKRLEELDKEANKEVNLASTCNIEPLYGPACRKGICQSVAATY